MSFLSVVSKIEDAVKFFSPIALSFLPGGSIAANILSAAPSIIQHMQSSIVSTEAVNSQVKSGDVKHADAVNAWNQYLATTKAIAGG